MLESFSKSQNSKPAKLEKSQVELRGVLEQRFKSMEPQIDFEIAKYEQYLEDGTFEDGEGEEEGTGERRKSEMQKKLEGIMIKAEKMKERLDSNEPLPQTTPSITSVFEYQDEKGGKHQESITLDIEAKLEEFQNFYQQHNINLPPDWSESITEIWQKHESEIQEAMEQHGFNDILLVPPNIPLSELADKLKMENGYYFGSNFENAGGFDKTISLNTDKPRIILVHNLDTLSEIKQKSGLDIHLNIKAEDATKLYEANPTHYLSTLEDFLILENKHFQETGKHLSDYQTNSVNWLPGSKSGSRFVCSCWHPDGGRLDVRASGAGAQRSDLGVRPSRCFY